MINDKDGPTWINEQLNAMINELNRRNQNRIAAQQDRKRRGVFSDGRFHSSKPGQDRMKWLGNVEMFFAKTHPNISIYAGHLAYILQREDWVWDDRPATIPMHPVDYACLIRSYWQQIAREMWAKRDEVINFYGKMVRVGDLLDEIDSNVISVPVRQPRPANDPDPNSDRWYYEKTYFLDWVLPVEDLFLVRPRLYSATPVLWF